MAATLKSRKKISAARLAANRKNAQRSTGPKTAEGKAKVRTNAVKHGFRAQNVVLPDERQAVAERTRDYAHDLKPRTRLQRDFITQAALAAVRLERVRDREAEMQQRHHELAIDAFAVHRQRQVKRIAKNLDSDPLETVATLESLAFGCDWILQHWDDLRAPLNQLEPHTTSIALDELWDEADQHLALALCGLDPDMPLVEQTDDHPLATLLVNDSIDVEALRSLIDAEEQRLEELAQVHWDDSEQPALDIHLLKAATEAAREGVKLLSYEARMMSQMHRALSDFQKLAASPTIDDPDEDFDDESDDSTEDDDDETITPEVMAQAQAFLARTNKANAFAQPMPTSVSPTTSGKSVMAETHAPSTPEMERKVAQLTKLMQS